MDRRRIELVEPGMTAAPIHYDSARLDVAATAALVAKVRASVARATSAALDELAAALPEPIVSISLRDLADRLPRGHRRPAPLPYEARADAIMYRQVLAEVAHDRGWPVHLYDAKDVLGQAASAAGRPGRRGPGRPPGPAGPALDEGPSHRARRDDRGRLTGSSSKSVARRSGVVGASTPGDRRPGRPPSPPFLSHFATKTAAKRLKNGQPWFLSSVGCEDRSEVSQEVALGRKVPRVPQQPMRRSAARWGEAVDRGVGEVGRGRASASAASWSPVCSTSRSGPSRQRLRPGGDAAGWTSRAAASWKRAERGAVAGFVASRSSTNAATAESRRARAASPVPAVVRSSSGQRGGRRVRHRPIGEDLGREA